MLESFPGLRKFFADSKLPKSIRKYRITTKRTKDTKDRKIITFQFFLRALRDLRGDNVCFDFGCGAAALGLGGEIRLAALVAALPR